jgi:hypothetical protein
MYFFTAIGAVELVVALLCLHLQVIALASLPILLASSALVDGHVMHVERLPGALETRGTLPPGNKVSPFGSKVSGEVGIEVVSMISPGALETSGREVELAAAVFKCSNSGKRGAFAFTQVLLTTAAGVNSEMCITGRVYPLLLAV